MSILILSCFYNIYVQIIKKLVYTCMRYICYIYCIMSMSIKVSDNNVYLIHIHLYRSGPTWLDILCTQIAGDNSICKILTPNITYRFNYLTCRVIQTKYTEYPTELDALVSTFK